MERVIENKLFIIINFIISHSYNITSLCACMKRWVSLVSQQKWECPPANKTHVVLYIERESSDWRKYCERGEFFVLKLNTMCHETLLSAREKRQLLRQKSRAPSPAHLFISEKKLITYYLWIVKTQHFSKNDSR